MLTGFFDESGEDAPDKKRALKRLTIGGFFAPWSSIEALCVEWREALDQEALQSFHMKDIASDEHNYEHWAPDRQKRLDRFVDILCKRAAQFSAFNYAVTSEKTAFKEAYEMGLSRVLIAASSLAQQTGERADIVFAHTHEIREDLIGRFFMTLKWGEFLDGYQVRQSDRTPPLQAAEIVARGLKRFMQDGLVTHSFGRILEAGKPLRFWPEQACRVKGVPNPTSAVWL